MQRLESEVVHSFTKPNSRQTIHRFQYASYTYRRSRPAQVEKFLLDTNPDWP